MNQQSLDNAIILKPDLYHIKNIFSSDEIFDISERLDRETEWNQLSLQEIQSRQTLAWKDHGLLDHVWCLINNLDFSAFGLKFTHVSIWKDQHPYCITKHIDNDQVKAAMQIYLSSGPEYIGTWFDDVEIPFVTNTGYIMNNKNKLEHQMKHPVPRNLIRYSLYALFDYV